MKYAGLLALVICLLVPTSAEARKRCRPVGESPAVEASAIEEEPNSSLHWARGNDSSWVHEGASSWHQGGASSWHHDSASSWHHEVDNSWHHASGEASAAESVAFDPNEGAGWVHETDYGWWAAVPEAVLNEVGGEGDHEDSFAEEEEDCTVSKDRNECVVLANQVARYQFRLGLAIERDDVLWAENLQLTITRLQARAEFVGCPWSVQTTIQEQIIETVKKVIEAGVVAARVYSMFYRMGLF